MQGKNAKNKNNLKKNYNPGVEITLRAVVSFWIQSLHRVSHASR
jgi:hypothetical protein